MEQVIDAARAVAGAQHALTEAIDADLYLMAYVDAFAGAGRKFRQAQQQILTLSDGNVQALKMAQRAALPALRAYIGQAYIGDGQPEYGHPLTQPFLTDFLRGGGADR